MFEVFEWLLCSGIHRKGEATCTCGKKLLKYNLQPGSQIETKCPRCSTVNEYYIGIDFAKKED